MRDLAEFEVLKGLDVREHAEVVLHGIEEIERRAPTGYPPVATLQRFEDRCNRDWQWMFVGARDKLAADPKRAVCGWIVMVLWNDHMGTPVANVLMAWVAKGYHGEPLLAMAATVKRYADKQWRAKELVTFTGRFDQQDKTAGTTAGYAHWAEAFGLKPGEQMYRMRLT